MHYHIKLKTLLSFNGRRQSQYQEMEIRYDLIDIRVVMLTVGSVQVN